MILGISSNLIAGLFETWCLGQLGTSDLAAYSFTFPVTGALMSISLGVSIGISSVLARVVGSGDEASVRHLATDGISLAVVIMLAVSIIGLLTIEPLFALLGTNDQTLPLVVSYMQIWYAGLIFLTVPAVGANALRATGDARISGTIMVAGAILQMMLAPILIFGLMGFPSMGITGAAVAMIGSRFVLFVVTLYFLHAREHLLDFSGIGAGRIASSWRRILAVSIPATATNLIGPVSTAIIVSMLAGFGQEAVAGFGIASRIEGLFVIPLFALSASIGPYVGQNWGANLQERANEAMILSFRYSMTWGLFVAAILFTFGANITRQFDDNAAVTDVATWYLAVVPISYGAWGMLMMASAIFNSLGRPLSSTIMSIVRMFVIYVPAAWLGQRIFGLEGIFVAASLANLVMGTAGWLWNRRTYLPVVRQARLAQVTPG